jgi:adenylate cyclase
MTTTRRLAAILAADVAGYSRLMGTDEVGTLEALKAHRREVVDPTIAAHHGRIVKTTGDGLLVEFASAVDAVTCAMSVQEQMSARNANGTGPRIEFRIGINIGDIISEGDDIFGDGVNVAARVENECEPGAVYLSSSAHEQVLGKTKFIFEDLGERTLKNIARPVRLYAAREGTGASGSPRGLEAPPLPDKPSIAVLPFQNMSGDAEQEYFTDGMVEDIITALSRFRSLFVIDRNSSFTYKSKAIDVKQVGRELGVRYVLEGSVRRAADHLRISGQLIDASTGGHLWADHFDGVLEDVFELQDRVTSSVVGAIAPKLEQAETERAMRKPPESLDAYDCFLRALPHFHSFARDGFLEARRLFRRATDLDPTYAAAYGYQVWCIITSLTSGWLADPEREITEGVRLARRALATGINDPVALLGGGGGLAFLAGELENGIGHVDRAILLNPNYAFAWSVSGFLRMYRGEHADALERFEHAIRLSPFDLGAHTYYAGMSQALVFAGRFDEAISLARKAALGNPNGTVPARWEAIACALSGRIVEAREALARMRAIEPDLRLRHLESGRGVAAQFRRAEDRALVIEGLRIAGLPE